MSDSFTSSAALLEPSGIHTLEVRHAMDKLIEAASPERSHANAAYGVLIYHAAKKGPVPNIFSATGRFVRAYLKGWTALSKMEVDIVGIGEGRKDRIDVFEQNDVRYFVKVFAGKAAVNALKREAKPSPGVYINTAHLDTLLLDDLRLPRFRFRTRIRKRHRMAPDYYRKLFVSLYVAVPGRSGLPRTSQLSRGHISWFRFSWRFACQSFGCSSLTTSELEKLLRQP